MRERCSRAIAISSSSQGFMQGPIFIFFKGGINAAAFAGVDASLSCAHANDARFSQGIVKCRRACAALENAKCATTKPD